MIGALVGSWKTTAGAALLALAFAGLWWWERDAAAEARHGFEVEIARLESAADFARRAAVTADAEARASEARAADFAQFIEEMRHVEGDCDVSDAVGRFFERLPAPR
ncbi:MAG: hypothetical protein RLO50_06420 [Azospirillaceae bacterium]